MRAASPNVLFIMDDQHRFDYLGAAGADFVDTPNLDRLASRGVRFTQATTNAPVCAPARIALATGLLPTRLGTTSNETAFMPISTPNHYRHFRDHGYRVELIGRHDFAKPRSPESLYGNRPLNYSYGFTKSLELEGAMAATRNGVDGGPTGPYTAFLEEHGHLRTWLEDNKCRWDKGWIIGASHDSVLPANLHQDTYIGDQAVKGIEEIPDDYPWYMFVSFQAPHDPFDPPAELGEKYRHRPMPEPVPPSFEGKARRIYERYTEMYDHATGTDITEARRQYCAKIELVDQQVGRLLEALDRRGFTDNTIIVFTSDHGEHVGDHGLFIKHTAYEPSMRVPLIMAGPGIEAGVSDALVETFDVNPTLSELAGLPAQQHLDAKSVAQVLRGQAQAHRDGTLTCEDTYRAWRDDRFKFIQTDNDIEELYDLASDPAESNNLASDKPELVVTYRRKIRARLNERAWQN